MQRNQHPEKKDKAQLIFFKGTILLENECFVCGEKTTKLTWVSTFPLCARCSHIKNVNLAVRLAQASILASLKKT